MIRQQVGRFASTSRVTLDHLPVRGRVSCLNVPARIVPKRHIQRDALQSRLNQLGARWNALSGYDHIEDLKLRVSKLSEELNAARRVLREKRQEYVDAVSERSASQRELSDLLSRKAHWSETDLSRYTKLLHSEHSQSRSEKQAQQNYEDADEGMQNAFDELMQAIAQRYHEEHIWSDRMRSVSTWGSVGIAILNVVVFTLAIFIVEPFKRRRLAETLETRLLASEAENTERLQRTISSFQDRIEVVQSTLEDLSSPRAKTSEETGDPVESYMVTNVDKDVVVAASVGIVIALVGALTR